MNRDIWVHRNTLDEPDSSKVLERLEYYGYKIVYGWYPAVESDSYVIDRRSPNWRGWRDVLSSFSWRHYDKECEWNRGLDKKAALVYTESDDDCYT